MAANKVSLANLADLKNASDDAIANYLNSLSFQQSHTMTDVRLAIGYGAFVIAAAAGGWDYYYGFENTKLYTAVAVAVYSLLQGALAFWISFVEQGTVYQGQAPNSGQKISIASFNAKKTEPLYRLKVTTQPAASEGKPETIELERSFTEWFDESGLFVAAPFQRFLASSIPVVGRADPKRVKSESRDLLEGDSDLLDAVMSAEAETTGTDKKSGGKKRKV
ncbi:Signal peptidase complex subunit-like protein [Emericellopsis cladophorae]|uniref:Signal peptidase complex subunit 2 n=1 Tax=Emericellopsis cladophorae TaxID=2686198 RepID=A0A9P9XXJ6_9HYPO|nr:Signal peptidase complex subunit-like protein [Emericellopsis cladophorae]KAI6779713.1 Signal peptidase complex subunit-like protein [Emericellopsis cladophorae]